MDEKDKTGRVTDMELRIEYLPIERITPYENNARKHQDADVDAIVASINEFGFDDPIGVWGGHNVIVEGHGRLMAAKKLGMETVPVIRLDHLTDEQRRAYALAHNRTAELSEWDEVVKELELKGVKEIDMSLFGFDVSDIPTSENEIEEDEAPEVPEEPMAKPGDIYLLGRHRLMCGDSTDKEAWALLMDGEKADMVFTDPPYGVAIGDKNATLNSIQRSGRCCENIKNDTMTEQELYEMLKAAFINVRENCADDAVYFVTSPQGGSLGLMMMMMMMKDAGLEVRHVLIWRKNCATFSLGRLDYDYQHEPIFYTWTKSHHNYRGGKYRTTVWDFDKPRKCDVHPTMKPVDLVANAIIDGTRENMIVLDAFGGSGTTMIAAEQLGRNCRMMELDPHYVDVIIKRWENLTGQKAKLINGA